MLERNHLYHFLLILLFGALALMFFTLRPFLEPLVLAAVFAFLFQPVYEGALRLTRSRRTPAAFITTLIATIVIVVPVTLIASQILNESKRFYATLTESGTDSFIVLINDGINRLRSLIPLPADFRVDINEHLRQAIAAITNNLGAAFESIAKMTVDVLVFLMAFFFLVKDGRSLKNYLVTLSPLSDRDDELIVSRLKLAVLSVVKGNLLIGAIQGILTGVGFTLFQVPNPVLWGIVAAVAALIPGVGTSLVLIPGIIYLYLTGNPLESFGLLLWGIAAVGLIDNLLGPKLIGRGMQLHPLAVFLSVLGGLALFGPLGFLLGPISTSLCLTLIDIYFSLRSEKPTKQRQGTSKK